MPAREPDVRYVVPENLTDEQIAEARERLNGLARSLGRISARVCHDMGIQFDMDDPEVAREVLRLTFEGLFVSAPKKRSKRNPKAPKATEPTD
jgi:predicted DNA-binding protein